MATITEAQLTPIGGDAPALPGPVYAQFTGDRMTSEKLPVSFLLAADGSRLVKFGGETSIPDSPIARINGKEYYVYSVQMRAHDREWRVDEVNLHGRTADGRWTRDDLTQAAWRKLLEWLRVNAPALAEQHQARFRTAAAAPQPRYWAENGGRLAEMAKACTMFGDLGELLDSGDCELVTPRRPDAPEEVTWVDPAGDYRYSVPEKHAEVVGEVQHRDLGLVGWLVAERTSGRYSAGRPLAVPVDLARPWNRTGWNRRGA